MKRFIETYRNRVGLWASIYFAIISILLTMMIMAHLQISKHLYENKVVCKELYFTAYTADGSYDATTPLRIVENLAYYETDSTVIEKNAIIEKTDVEGVFIITNKEFTLTFDDLASNITYNDGFKMVTEDESEMGYGYFEAEKDGATIGFNLPVFTSTCISVEKNSTNSNLHVYDKDGDIDHYLLNNRFEEGTGLSSKFFMFCNSSSIYIIVYYVISYAMVFALLYIVFLVIYVYVCQNLWRFKFLNSFDMRTTFLLILGLQVILSGVQYGLNPNAYEVSKESDAYYYMYPELMPQFLNEEGVFSWDLYIQNGYPHRGYITLLIAFIVNSFAKLIQLQNVTCVYIFLNSIYMSLLCAVAIPMLYEFFTKKKTKNISVLVMWIIMNIFWGLHVIYALTDLPSVTFMLLAIVFFLKGIENRISCKNLVISGVMWGISIAFRVAYAYLVKISLVVILIVGIYRIIKNKNWDFKGIIKTAVPSAKGCVALYLGMVLVLLPQLMINIQRGNATMYPHFNPSYKVNSDEARGFNLASLKGYKFGGTNYLDEQINEVWYEYYVDEKRTDLSMEDTAFIILDNPIEFSAAMCKKLFYGISPIGNSIYNVGGNGLTKLNFYINLFLNYAVWAYCFFYVRKVAGDIKYYKGFIGMNSIIIFILLIGQIVWSHVEHRYYMAVYALFYAYFSNFVINRLVEKKSNKMNADDFMMNIKVLLIVIMCYVGYTTISKNFF